MMRGGAQYQEYGGQSSQQQYQQSYQYQASMGGNPFGGGGQGQGQRREAFGARRMSAQTSATLQQSSGKIGLKLKESKENGVMVYRVVVGEAAERAGVLTNDLVTYVNNRPTRNLDEFREVINNANGPLSLQVVRLGGRKLLLAIVR
jgi:S1-C subfamily serine protease